MNNTKEYRPFTIELTEAQIDALKADATQKEMSPSAWFRLYVDEWLQGRAHCSKGFDDINARLDQLLSIQQVIIKIDKLVDVMSHKHGQNEE